MTLAYSVYAYFLWWAPSTLRSSQILQKQTVITFTAGECHVERGQYLLVLDAFFFFLSAIYRQWHWKKIKCGSI